MARDVDSEGFQLLQYGIASAEYPELDFDITRLHPSPSLQHLSDVCLAELPVWYCTVVMVSGEWRRGEG
jgi:hypothetical protein